MERQLRNLFMVFICVFGILIISCDEDDDAVTSDNTEKTEEKEEDNKEEDNKEKENNVEDDNDAEEKPNLKKKLKVLEIDKNGVNQILIFTYEGDLVKSCRSIYQYGTTAVDDYQYDLSYENNKVTIGLYFENQETKTEYTFENNKIIHAATIDGYAPGKWGVYDISFKYSNNFISEIKEARGGGYHSILKNTFNSTSNIVSLSFYGSFDESLFDQYATSYYYETSDIDNIGGIMDFAEILGFGKHGTEGYPSSYSLIAWYANLLGESTTKLIKSVNGETVFHSIDDDGYPLIAQTSEVKVTYTFE